MLPEVRLLPVSEVPVLPEVPVLLDVRLLPELLGLVLLVVRKLLPVLLEAWPLRLVAVPAPSLCFALSPEASAGANVTNAKCKRTLLSPTLTTQLKWQKCECQGPSAGEHCSTRHLQTKGMH